MTLQFKPAETFRDTFTYAKSPEDILRFPFPFPEDEYMYSVNIEPHVKGGPTAAFQAVFDIDEHYIAECRECERVLKEDPKRCQVLPHMMAAEWDTLELIMESMAADYPAHFSLTKAGDLWTWVNRPLGIQQSFTFGKAETLPCPPFEYITRQAQGDFTLQDQRDGNLYVDGGLVTTQADWSLEFDIGMSFHEWHGPVPLAHEKGVFDRALKYLLRLQYGQPVRRLNWTMTINPRLDTSPENYPVWGPDRTTVTPQNVAEKVHLRVELQTLFRLPRSGAILFGIRCYLASVADIARVPKWRRRLHRVLRDLNPALVEYKGLARYRPMVLDHLAPLDDGAPTTRGIAPDTEVLAG
ncbi:heme-dependent oxidative N-demethylase family protein [Xanthobacter sp. AM11]|uniref:heme-dependent oxidative N-demethylase family protein n=1 Tax=Xanthobacter sp. AM11 TaxID=3380643 RepID=UPI0039BF5C01